MSLGGLDSLGILQQARYGLRGGENDNTKQGEAVTEFVTVRRVSEGVCVLRRGENTWRKQRKLSMKLRHGPRQAHARPARMGACIVPACRMPINGARSVPI